MLCKSGLLTCTFYLNEDWDAEHDGGEIRLYGTRLLVDSFSPACRVEQMRFEEDQKQIKVDVAPEMNRAVSQHLSFSSERVCRPAPVEQTATAVA